MLSAHLCVPFGEMCSQVVDSELGGGILLSKLECFFAQSAHLLSDKRVANIFPFFRLFFHFLVSGFDMGILTKITFFYIPEFVVLG